jgi:hypothetical protein
MNIGKRLWFLTSGSAYSYSTEYQALLDWAEANGGTPPSTDALKQHEDRFVRALDYEGAYDLADQIFLLSTNGGETFSLANLKTPGTRNGSKVSTPTFTAGTGWNSAGSLSTYINSNYAPATHAVNLSQNSTGIVLYTPTNEAASGTKVEFGGNGAALLHAIVSSLFTGGTPGVNIRINAATSGTASGTGTSNGVYVLNRNSSTNIDVYKDGLLVSSLTVTSTGLTSSNLYLLVYNNNGAAAGGTTKTIGFWMIGAAFEDAIQPRRMQFNLSAYYNEYATTPETITSPSFADATDISNYISSISALSATFSATPTINQTLLKGASLVGNNKWQGAALSNNDCIYCAPSTAQSVLKIDTLTDTYSTFGTVTATIAKYGGAAYANGKVYFCPQQAKSVMCIDTSDDSITYFDTTGSVADADTGTLTGANKWYGIYLGADGYLYCVPYEATEVMRINPANNAITFIDTAGSTTYGNGNLSGSQKWDGGCVYGNYIYCSPSDATDFLKINTSAGTCVRFGSVAAGSAKWAITAIGPNDRIYFFPYFRNDILKLNPSDDSVSTLAATIGSVDTNIKIGGASIMPDGRILLTPANQTQSRILNTSTDALSTVGKDFSFITADRCIGIALARNGAAYTVPFTGQFIIKHSYLGKQVTLPSNFVLNRNGRYS